MIQKLMEFMAATMMMGGIGRVFTQVSTNGTSRTVLRDDLDQSAADELAAAMDYSSRARTARSMGYNDLADMYEHIADEELHHLHELTNALGVYFKE